MLIRKIIWPATIIVAVVLGAVWLMLDEPLEDQVKAAFDINVRPITADNGFVYLLGLQAPENQDPYALGESILTQYRQWLQNPTIAIRPAINATQTFRAPLWFDGSDEELLVYAKKIPYIVAVNAVLYTRYHAFLQHNTFETLMHLDTQTSDELSESLYIGNRFLRADVLSQAALGDTPKAAALLTQDITAWRTHLQASDSFTQKLLVARLLAKDFSLMATLTQKNIWTINELPLLKSALEPFSLKEISLEYPLLHAEFSKIGYALLEAQHNPSLIDARYKNDWRFKLQYKPNMSINFLYHQYLNVADENNMPPRQLLVNLQAPQKRQANISLGQWIKNKIGIIAVQNLLNTSFLPYTARLWDVDVNRLLTQLAVEANLSGINTKEALDAFIQQPRFRGVWDNQPPHYEANNRHLCYNGAIEDKKGLRCIAIDWLLHKSP